jgi:hypothetical protein
VFLKYLHSLHDVSKIKEFDWAGHILEVLMEEVDKYLKLSPEKLEHDHNIQACLAIFAVRRLSLFTVLMIHVLCYLQIIVIFFNLYLMIWLCAD